MNLKPCDALNDGYRWKCRCKNTLTIRTDSWFERSKLSLKTGHGCHVLLGLQLHHGLLSPRGKSPGEKHHSGLVLLLPRGLHSVVTAKPHDCLRVRCKWSAPNCRIWWILLLETKAPQRASRATVVGFWWHRTYLRQLLLGTCGQQRCQHSPCSNPPVDSPRHRYYIRWLGVICEHSTDPWGNYTHRVENQTLSFVDPMGGDGPHIPYEQGGGHVVLGEKEAQA